MNLFLWLSQFGLAGELFGERLAPYRLGLRPVHLPAASTR